MPVTIAEELLLLALDDTEGTQRGDGTKVSYAVVGAHLIELAIAGRVGMDGKKVVAHDSSPVGEPATDHVLDAIATQKRPRKPGDWLWTLGTKSIEATRQSLVDKGLVRQDEHKVLGIFKSKRYPSMDGGAEHAALERIRGAVVGGQQPDARTAGLISMVHAAGLSKGLLPDTDQKAAVKRMEEIAKQPGDVVNDATVAAVAATVSAIQIAVVSAALSGAVAASASG